MMDKTKSFKPGPYGARAWSASVGSHSLRTTWEGRAVPSTLASHETQVIFKLKFAFNFFSIVNEFGSRHR